MSCNIFVFSLCLLQMIALALSAGSFANHARLRNNLFQDYDPGLIPAEDAATPVNTSLGLTLINMNYVWNKGYLYSNVWMEQTWDDFRLQWDPEMYDGIHHITVDYKDLWRPDITLYNSVKPQDMNPPSEEGKVIVYNTGSVMFIRHVELHSACERQRTETFECNMKMGSWVYSGESLNLTNSSDVINMGSYFDNPSFKVTKTEAKRNVKHYACCPEPYIDTTFTVWIKKRRSGY